MPHHKQLALVPVRSTAPAVQAAAYVRMSTEHQKYSIVNQLSAIQDYAVAHALSLVRVYSDEGISGLRIDNRLGLQSLINDVVSGKPDFSKVLVYDVSRWGRFQDTDESAYYEYCCRRNGVDVIYCAEPFDNDRSPLSALIKSMKRTMAAEYSRELGAKVFRASCTVAGRGYNPGGRIPYGFRFVLVNSDGVVIKRPTGRKTLPGYRVVLTPGPPHEVRIVREIFRRFVDLKRSTPQIASYLNRKGYRTRSGGLWESTGILYMLANEKYAGTQTYNRTSARLRERRIRNSESDWIRKPGAFKGIVDPELFARAEVRRRKCALGPYHSDAELLALLRALIAEHHVVNFRMFRREFGMPSTQVYARRFGSLRRAYDLVGYDLYARSAWISRKQLEDIRLSILQEIEDTVLRAGEHIRIGSSCRLVMDWLRCSFSVVKRYRADMGYGWKVRIRHVRNVDFHLVGRLGADDRTLLDYYLFPTEDAHAVPTRVGRHNIRSIAQYRCSDLGIAIGRLAALAGQGRSAQVSRKRHR